MLQPLLLQSLLSSLDHPSQEQRHSHHCLAPQEAQEKLQAELSNRRQGLVARHEVAVQRHLDAVQAQHEEAILKRLGELENGFPVSLSQAKADMERALFDGAHDGRLSIVPGSALGPAA